jgi:Peptidyl-tRNA hydrolase PTH2
MSKVDKLYLVTRADLEDGQQAVQAAHSLREFVALHPEIDQAWYKQSNTLAFLVVADEPALGVLLQKAANRNIPVAPFHEPDRNNEMTAIALGPAARNLCSGLPLALQRGCSSAAEQRPLSSPAVGSNPTFPTAPMPELVEGSGL